MKKTVLIILGATAVSIISILLYKIFLKSNENQQNNTNETDSSFMVSRNIIQNPKIMNNLN